MRRSVVLVFTCLLGLALGSCSAKRERSPGGEHSKQASHDHAPMEDGEPTDNSIYHVESTWTTQGGKQIQLKGLQGKIQVVAMVYTHCEFACPRILADMKRIRSSLSETEQEQTNFVIVSIDPDRDTPRRLKEFAVENNLASDNWTLLHGKPGNILELAALLDVKYKRISDTDFTHSNIITVLDRQGEIAFQQMKLGDQPVNAVQAIKSLTN
jgi:protein SCO1/2